jgi:hypothetical protein
VTTYNITITPQDDPRIQTTISVEVERTGRAVRVTEMTVRAAKGAGLPGSRLPAVDVELLLRAILPPAAGQEPPRARGRAGKQARPAAARQSAAAERRDSKRSGTSTARRAPAGGDMRAYRRMPDDLAETYAQLNSITALAQHYGVPRHTAQGWMNRMRKQGAAAQ